MKRRRQSPSALRRATGLVLSLLLTLSYFSPSQQALRNLPDTLHLTAGQLQTLELGSMLTLTTQEGTAAVSSSEDETLRARVSHLLFTPPSEDTNQLIRMAQDCVATMRLNRMESRVRQVMQTINGLSGDAKKAALDEVTLLTQKIKALKATH